MSGILNAFVGGSYGSKPVNTVAPAVTGTAQYGQTLSVSTGTWSAVPPITGYTYQWYRSPSTAIGGATSNTYTLVLADVGNTIYCTVTATNAIASVSANSNTTSTVIASVPNAPTIGTATTTGATTATVSYTASTNNGGATITSYTAVSSPGGITGTLSTSGSGTITVSGLSSGTSYTFTVYATNSIGNSASSSSSNSITTFTNFYTSRNGNVTEGTSSNYATVSSNLTTGSSWNYNGGNCDVITITPNQNVYLDGIGIGNYGSGTNSFNFIIGVFNGGSTNSSQLVNEFHSGVALNTGAGTTIVMLYTPVLLTAGNTYTIGFGWPSGYTNGISYYINSAPYRGSSSVTINGVGFSVTYGGASQNGTSPWGSDNGTSFNGSGQDSVLLFTSTW